MVHLTPCCHGKMKKIANSKPYAKKVEPLDEGLIVELKSEAENLS